MGVVKELVGSERLGFANGVMEGAVVLMILLGQIIGGFWYDAWGLQNGLTPWTAAMISSFMDFGWSCFISLFFPPDPEDKISIGRDFFVGDDGKAFWGFTGTKKKRGIVAVRFGDCLFLELWRFFFKCY